jgi:hypothetical protein
MPHKNDGLRLQHMLDAAREAIELSAGECRPISRRVEASREGRWQMVAPNTTPLASS